MQATARVRRVCNSLAPVAQRLTASVRLLDTANAMQYDRIMKRRTFIKATLAAVPLTLAAQQPPTDTRKRAVHVTAGQDRFDEPYKFAVGHIECKVSQKDTAGAMSAFEALTTKQDRPAKHFHHSQDEWFYTIEGEYELHVGDDKFHLGPGDSVLAPRKVPHVWGCVSEKPGRLLTIFQPAGEMEAFFRELPKYVARNASVEELQKLFRAHGMEVVGPRLPIQ